jgi:biopolymer transport protein ExbD
MAELDTSSSGGGKKGGVRRSKKLSTRVDMTPMVDLGFLLITFFIFTTTLSKPKTMELNMPVDEKDIKKPDEKNKVKASTVLTVLLSKQNRMYYYYGIGDDPKNPPAVKVSKYDGAKGGDIRKAIQDLKIKVKELQATPGSNINEKDEATVIIKPDTNSSYKDVVDILDEMAINDINIYALVDIGQVDRDFIKATEQANGEQ